ncbi:ATP-grasp domain-containing protein [Vibrio splendidus]|nr:ATP-grasp domain-containing protein [Vibrio splendidus]
MNIVVMHKVPFSYIGYDKVIDHDVHNVIYVGLEKAVADIPENLRCQRLKVGCFDEVKSVLQTIVNAKGIAIDRLISMSQYTLELAADLRQFFSIPGHGPDFVARTENKVVMKSLLHGDGLLAPRFIRLSNGGEINEVKWAGKTILKPVSDTASRGVKDFESPEMALAFYHRNLENSEYDWDKYELEQFIEGDIYHFDGFRVAGKTLLNIPSKFVGNCLDFAKGKAFGAVQADRQIEFEAQLEKFLNSIGIQHGPFHLEAINTKEGLCFLEVSSRVGGAGIQSCLEARTGLNMIHCELALQLSDLPIDSNPFKDFFCFNPNEANYGYFVFPGHQLESSDEISLLNIDSFLDNSNLLKYHVQKDPNEISSQITYNDGEVPFSGIVATKSYKESVALVQDILSSVKIAVNSRAQ